MTRTELDVTSKIILADQQQEAQESCLRIIEKQTQTQSSHSQETSSTYASVGVRVSWNFC